jgi:hypothetical protein
MPSANFPIPDPLDLQLDCPTPEKGNVLTRFVDRASAPAGTMMVKRTSTTPETSQEMSAAAHPPISLTAASCLYPCVPTAKPEQLLLREFRVADTSAHIPLSHVE